MGDADGRGAGGDCGWCAGGGRDPGAAKRRRAGGDAEVAAGRDECSAFRPASAEAAPARLAGVGLADKTQDAVRHLVGRLELNEVAGVGHHV